MRTWITLLYFLFLVYPSVSSTVIHHYVCKTISDSKNSYEFLLADLSIACKTDKWWTYAYIGFPLIALYPIGIPAFFFALLYRHRHQLQEPRIKAKFGFLYNGYELHAWWWEILDSVHKLFLTSLVAFFPKDAQLPVAMGAAVLYMIALLLWEPFLRDADDVLALLCQNLLLLLILAGYFFYDKDTTVLSTSEDIGMTIALLIAAAVFLGVFLAVTIDTFRQFFRIFIDQFCRRDRRKSKDRAEIEMAAANPYGDGDVSTASESSEDSDSAVAAEAAQPRPVFVSVVSLPPQTANTAEGDANAAPNATPAPASAVPEQAPADDPASTDAEAPTPAPTPGLLSVDPDADSDARVMTPSTRVVPLTFPEGHTPTAQARPDRDYL
jgi:hypothetical protein